MRLAHRLCRYSRRGTVGLGSKYQIRACRPSEIKSVMGHIKQVTLSDQYDQSITIHKSISTRRGKTIPLRARETRTKDAYVQMCTLPAAHERHSYMLAKGTPETANRASLPTSSEFPSTSLFISLGFRRRYGSLQSLKDPNTPYVLQHSDGRGLFPRSCHVGTHWKYISVH